jgi:hypothetical protein
MIHLAAVLALVAGAPLGLGARLRCGAKVAAVLLFTWSLHVWNLLGWRM